MAGVVEPAAWTAADWALCGQGKSNLVLRDGRGAVLRIQKQAQHACGDASHDALERELWAHVPGFSSAGAPVQRAWLFAAHVLSPLLDFTAGVGTLVRLPAEFVRHVETRLALVPGALGSDTGRTVWAQLLPDHACLQPLVACDAPVFVMELKPKCGFLPAAAAVGADSVKRHTSRFALHQRLKLAQGRIHQVSSYCPLRLFSGDPHHMAAAVRALLATPQNNLSIRRDGMRVFGGAGDTHVARVDSLAAPHSALAHALRGLCPAEAPGDVCAEVLVSLLVDILQSCGALSRLLAVQRLDTHDIEGAYQLYRSLMPCAGGADAVEDALGEACKVQATQPSRAEMLAVLRDFLTAQAAKDCAVMVCMQRLPPDEHAAALEGHTVAAHAASGVRVRYSVAFVDLDLKPVHRMQHYEQLDRAVQQA